jgi:hypothetical protein
MRLHDIIKMRAPNDGTRSLFESAMMPELIAALRDWQRANTGGTLIGGMGLSYHVRPRMTQDLDFLFMSEDDVPDQVSGFTRTRPHAFQHVLTHVEVEIITPEFVKVPASVVRQAIVTATESNGIRIASAAGLVALKLFRLSVQDKADIVALIKSGRVSDLTTFALPLDKVAMFDELVIIAQTDPHPG